MSRDHPWTVAEKAKLIPDAPEHHLPDRVTVHVSVIHGSSLIGQGYGAFEALTQGDVELVAAGPRAARLRRPPATASKRATSSSCAVRRTRSPISSAEAAFSRSGGRLRR